MKARLTGLFLCMLMFCMSIFAGCSLVTRDMAKYLSTKVATITLKEGKGGDNDSMTITKKDLITAYNTYGNYYQQYGYSAKQAMEQTIELLIRRRITIAQAEELYPELSEKEKTYLWVETSDALKDNYNSYLNEVLGITDSSSTDEDGIKFTGYTKNARPDEDQNGKSIILKINTQQTELDQFTYEVARDFDKKEDKDFIYTNFVDTIREGNNKNSSEAFDEYYKALLKNEEGQKLSEDRPSVFAREIERLYNVIYENFMIEKYQEYYTSPEDNVSYISSKQVVDRYTSKVRASYTKYMIENTSTYDSDMKSGANNIYYYKSENDDTKFFKVAHILFKFTDEQTEIYNEIEEASKNGEYATPAEKQRALDSLYSQVVPLVREKNEETGIYEEVADEDKKSFETSAQALRDYIARKVAEGRTAYEKADIFNELIYKYNEDPGMINPTDIYAIGVDGEGKAVSNFVQEFNDGGIKLYNNGQGQIGDISDLVYSENGIHVMFYAGEVKNLFKGITESFELEEDAIDALSGYRPNILLDKTLFDTIYDELISDNYAIFENLQMNEIKQLYTIKVYTNSYKDLI